MTSKKPNKRKGEGGKNNRKKQKNKSGCARSRRWTAEKNWPFGKESMLIGEKKDLPKKLFFFSPVLLDWFPFWVKMGVLGKKGGVCIEFFSQQKK